MITLADLEGTWRLSRRIEDLRAGLTGRFRGTSRWHPDGHGLRQEEDGILDYGQAAPMQATRVYLWRQDGADLAVFFEDGRPFHRLSAQDPTDRHLCDPDTYDVRYAFDHWPDWTQHWRINGPRKDALITSRFQPLP
jgi:hypothetical protein